MSDKDIPEGRRSLLAGALESGSPYAVARDAHPRGAALGGVAQDCASFSTEPKLTIRSRGRRRRVPYTIIQGDQEKTVVARSALKALRRIDLTPGAIVTVFIPQIVHAKRLPR